MKYLSTLLLFIGSLLFSPKSFSEETDTQRNFKPCQIMIDQLYAYAKIDPLKGESSDYFYVWGNDDIFVDEYREERLQRSVINRAMKPGIGKAYFHPTQLGLKKLNKFFEQEHIHSPDVPAPERGAPYDRGNLQFYDLTKTSGYVIVTGSGGTAHCIYNYTLKTTKVADGYVWSESEPSFGEGDLCAPSDIAVVNVDGTDYLLINASAGSSYAQEEDIGKDYLFHMELFPLGIKKTKLSECSFYVRLKITGHGMGIFQGASPAPRNPWEW